MCSRRCAEFCLCYCCPKACLFNKKSCVRFQGSLHAGRNWGFLVSGDLLRSGLVMRRKSWEGDQHWQEKRKKLREWGPIWRDVMMLWWSVLTARACGSWCWQVCRTTSEKIVGVVVLGSEVKSDAMWHVPQDNQVYSSGKPIPGSP